MVANINSYLDRIQQEHPIASWSLDDNFSANLSTKNIDSIFPSSTPIAISSISQTSDGFTINTASSHGLVINDTLTITGATPTSYNKRYRVATVPTNTSITVVATYPGAMTVNGSINKAYDAYQLTQYNSFKNPGYYVTTSLLQNSSPIIYGSQNSQYGSFILPNFGFLSKSGGYEQYTFEVWMKLKRKDVANNKYKIIGLFNSTSTDDGNGLYYTDSSLILKIGNKSGKVFVKQTNQPLLVHIMYSDTACSLVINGEEAISLILDNSDISMLANNTKYISLQSAFFDCPAIYPYVISLEQAKLHFAYGQAAIMPKAAQSYGGKNVSIDFASSKYGPSLNYPTNGQWKTGVYENISVSDRAISNSEHTMPNFNFYDYSAESLPSLSQYIAALGIGSWKTKPTGFSTTNMNVEFPTMDIFDTKLKGFYTIFTTTGAPATNSEKTIYKIINKRTKDYFRIALNYNGTAVQVLYYAALNSNTETLVATQTNPQLIYVSTYIYTIGLDIDKFSLKYNSDSLPIANFFNNLSELTMFAYGDNDIALNKTPDVTVTAIRFLTKYFLDKKSSLVDANGCFYTPSNILSAGTSEYDAHTLIASYGISYNNQNVYGAIYPTSSTAYSTESNFTIETSGYWKNSVPLTHFAQYVKDVSGNNVYTFNYLQYNVDYDSPRKNTSPVSGIKYFNTTNSKAKTYITFETLLNGYQSDSYFTNGTKSLSIDRTVRPDSNWATTKYEVVDGTIIYPPTGVDISTIYLVKHIDISISDTNNHAVNIKSLELASQSLSLDGTQSTDIGTVFGYPITPYTYTLNGATKVYDYSGLSNARNPLLIAKKTTPYVNMERMSGIRLVGFDVAPSGVYRGIKLPINEKQNSSVKITSLQMSIFYDATNDPSQSNLDAFQFDTKDIFSIVASDRTLTATLTNTSGIVGTYLDTAILSISTSLAGVPNDSNIKYYINGQLTAVPIIKTNEWTVVTIEFYQPLNFDNFVGELDILGPLSIDNISYYTISNAEYLAKQVPSATWSLIWKPDMVNAQTWNSYTSQTWTTYQTVFEGPSIPTSKVYGLYTGTNVLYPGQFNQNKRINLYDLEYRHYSGYLTARYTYQAN